MGRSTRARLGACLGAAALALGACNEPPTPNDNAPAAANSDVAADAAIAANGYLLAASPKVRAATLAKAVGENCRGQRAFYMGFGDAGSGAGAGDGFWSIRCTDGRSFEVEVHPDGTSDVLECAVLEAVHAGHCFRKFST